jgi:uncharacterized protein YeaO (DUF488 family)
MTIAIKRIQDPASPDDGLRVFIERTWPRGVKKEQAEVTVWAKNVGPGEALAKASLSTADDWRQFRKQYQTQLDAAKQAVDDLTTLARSQPITLLHSSKDAKKNCAIVLRDYLAKRLDH